MKRVPTMPFLAAVVFAAACGEDPTAAATTASVRFFNATTGMAGNGGFTTNGQFATGSALAFAQSTQTCVPVEAGSTSFGFGTANTGGTGLSGDALATLNDQSVTAGGNYTAVATGSATSPQLYLLNNTFSRSLGTNQAAVRFVNLAPGPNPLPNTFTIIQGTLASGGTLMATSILVGSPTNFATVTSGSNAFEILRSHTSVISGSAATVTLPAGSVNTIAIVSNPTSDGFQLINIPRC